MFALSRLILFSSSLIFSLCISSVSSAGVLLQGFYWDSPSEPQDPWWDKIAQLSSEISDDGFSAIWLPPVLKGDTGGYSMGYDPFDDYDIGSKDQKGTYPTRWGTREQLHRVVAMLRSNGLDVYLDSVLAHRKGDPGDKSFLYKDSYNLNGRGRFQKGPMDFHFDDTPFGRHLKHDSPYVRGALVEAGDWLARALDIQGLRFDYVKMVPPEFISDYMQSGRMSQLGGIAEYWGSLDEIRDYIHRSKGRVSAFDFPLWEKLRGMSNGQGYFDMRELVRAGLVGRDPYHAVTFVENHDTDKDHPSFDKRLGYAYILTSEGVPTVFWKDYFNTALKQDIKKLVWIHEILAHGETQYRWSDPDLLVYERTGAPGVLVALNDNRVASRTEWVQTNFGANVELQDYSGQQKGLWTNEHGWVQITVPANGYVAYSRAGIQANISRRSFAVTQQFAGAEDLDIPPAESGEYKTVGRIYSEANRDLKWNVTFASKNLPVGSNLCIRILDPKGSVVAEQKSPASQSVIAGAKSAQQTGYHSLQIKTENAPNTKTDFWWDQMYQAPKK